MKNTINKLLIILLVIGLAGCEADPLLYDSVNGQTLVSFSSSSGTLPVPQEGASFTIPVEVSTVSNVDRAINVSVDASSTAGSAEYTINSAVIPAGSYSGNIEVVGNFDEIPDSIITNLILNLNGIEGTEAILGKTKFNLSLLRKCDSNLDVAFTYVATDVSYQGTPQDVTITGADTLVKVAGEDSKYVYGSGTFDFGYYCVIYSGADAGCGDGANGSLQLDDTCGKLSYIGADQYGDAWTISNVVVDGSNLTFTWESAFGESSRVTLTRTDGADWQAVF